jgi:hypothetical protein
MISTATAAVKANVASSPAPSQKPSVAAAMPRTTGTKTPGDAVGQALYGRLARLRLGHEPPDLRERGVGTDARRADDQPAARVDRGARDLVARVLLDGYGLAGQQGLVDRARALLDHAVGGDLLARAHDEPVARAELLDGHAALGPVLAEHGDVLGAQLEQGGQRRPGAALGSRLEVSPGEQEDGDRGGDLEVDLVRAARPVGDEVEGHAHPGIAASPRTSA